MSNARYGFRTFTTGEVRTLARKGVLPFVADFFDNLFGVPEMAYSLRRLSSTATNCIRVRRSNDNAEQDIGFTGTQPNASVDTSAITSFVGANDGFIVTWYNQGSLGNASQSTGAKQPRIVSGGTIDQLNSLPVVKNPNNNVERYLDTSISTLEPLPVTVIFAGRITAKASNAFGNIGWHFGGTGGTGGARYELFSEDNGIIANRRSGALLTQSSFNTNAFIQQGIFRTSQLDGRFNGVNNTPVSYSGTAFATTSNFIIGGAGGGSSIQPGLESYEFIVYYADKFADRANIETDIDSYYGIL
jgi:hypothetical protein